MAINKIAYFVHSDYLIEKNEPLVGAKIEAWLHGPVFRELYQEFKRWDEAPIRGRATRVDVDTGEVIEASAQLEVDDRCYIESLVFRYIKFTASQLRALSHVEGGPWHKVWDHTGRSNPGMRITDGLIFEYHSPGVTQ